MQASLPIGCQGKGLKVTLVAAQRGDAFDFVKSAIGSAAPHQGSDSGLASLLSSTCASNCALFATCWLRSPPRSQTDISFRLFDLAKGAKVCPGAVPRLVPGVLRGPVRYAPTPSAVVVVDHARGRAHGLFAKRVCAAGLPAAGCHEYLLVQRLQQRHARSDLWHDGHFFHGHVSPLSVVIVISTSVSRGLEIFHAGVSSRVVVMAPHWPQRGMNIGTRLR